MMSYNHYWKLPNLFQGYQSHRAENEGMIDYKIKGKKEDILKMRN